MKQRMMVGGGIAALAAAAAFGGERHRRGSGNRSGDRPDLSVTASAEDPENDAKDLLRWHRGHERREQPERGRFSRGPVREGDYGQEIGERRKGPDTSYVTPTPKAR